MSPVIRTQDDDGIERGIEAAVTAVREGRLIVLPTDTVYGVGADAFDAAAVAALLEAKGRGREMPPPVLVPGVRTIDGLATDVPEYARRLVERYWPGALTVVLRAQASLMWDLGETNGTVALRMPDHQLALALLAETGPLAVTSANRTGEPAARTITEAASMLGPSVTVYLDAGPVGDAPASTIVDCTGDAPVVLREGAITPAEIYRVAEGGDVGAATAPAAAPAADVPDAVEEGGASGGAGSHAAESPDVADDPTRPVD